MNSSLFPSSDQPLRLTILTQFYPPDFAATGQFVEELAQNLARQGMAVHVFTGMPGYAYSQDREDAPRQEINAGVTVRRSRVSRWGDRHLLGRMLRGVLFCLRAVLYLCRPQNRGDLLLFVSEPPYLQTLGYLIDWLFQIPYACLVYDLYPEVAIELGLVTEQNWIVRLWNRINRMVWSHASVIIVPSDTMQERIVQRVPQLASKIVVIHNWADSNWIRPLQKQDNTFARQHNLADVFTVLYSGNMGRCHDMDTILDAAEELRHEAIQFVFIGGGPKRDACLHRVQDLGLANCKFLPYQERTVLPQSLTACDLALVSVAKGMEGLVAPSKFYSALASGRPVAVICEPHSYLRQMVADARCGAAFSNGDSSGLAAFIRYLARDRAMQERLGEAGHHYVAQHFTPQKICEQYKQVLQQAVLKNIDLKQAIENREFCLHYQAIFSLGTGRIQGFEALLRWQKDSDKLLYPKDFLPRLEATGWILELTGWILSEAAQRLKFWQTTYPLSPQYIRLNLSATQFFDPQLIRLIRQHWLGQGLSGSSLGFDVTETVLMRDPAAAIAILIQLQELGIQIYLDSFGSGISSLQSLHQFPLNGLALDRTLIGALGTKYGDRTLIESLLSLSENLQLPLHAEGIATAEQLQTLKSLGFQLGQGQWLAPPVEAAIVTQLLTDNRQQLLNDPFSASSEAAPSPDYLLQGGAITTLSQHPIPTVPSGPLALVVDDEAIMRKIFKRFLEQEGFQVLEAAEGQQALELYRRFHPCAILLDAVMPGMSGFDCCRQIQQLRREQIPMIRKSADVETTHIYLITSRDDQESVNLAFNAGADDYMTKPVNWAILRQRLRKDCAHQLSTPDRYTVA